MPGDAPMTCTVCYSKVYSLAMMVGVLLFAAVLAIILPRSGAPTAMRWVSAFAVSGALVALLSTVCTRKVVIRVDDIGILDHRGKRPLIEWVDVIAVERAPQTETYGRQTHSYLRDAWRPIRLTVRQPEKYRSGLQRALQPYYVPDSERDRTRVQIEFMGLTPGSDVVEACIRRHLARMGSVQAAS